MDKLLLMKINKMKSLYFLIFVLVILFIAGGIKAAFNGVGVITETMINFFPFLVPTIKRSLEDYLKSAYFITGIIIFICSTTGIIFTYKEKKWIYFIISIILDVISIISVASNLMICK